MTGARVWLNGERYDVAYLLDTAYGVLRRRSMKGRRVGKMAGMGRRLVGTFVAVYVDPDERELYLQIGDDRFPLDGSNLVGHETRRCGLSSELTVARAEGPPLVVRQWTVARAILRRADPGYDDLDESLDDFLATVADIANSPDRRRWILDTTDPFARPSDDDS